MLRPNRRWNWRKIFAVGFSVFGLAVCVTITAALVWVSSIRDKARRDNEQMADGERRIVPFEEQRQWPVRAANSPADQRLESEEQASGQSRARPPDIQTEPTLTRPTSTGPVQNTIAASSSHGSRSSAGDDIFRDVLIPRLKIEISTAGMWSLRARGRTYVRATIREGDNVYTNVAIRLKGGPGSFRSVTDIPSFTVNFDKFAEGQTFHGLKKIHLNSSVQDGSYLSEKIGRELFEASGVPTPRAGNAIVTFNGKTRLYGLVEGINKQFLRRYFKDVTGNVYDGHSGTDVTHDLPTNAGDVPTDKRRLKELANAARQPLKSRLAGLEKTLDLERFLSFMAMETILWHWDGYTMHRNNFRVYHDRDTDRMVFIPQGLDQILSKPSGSIVPHTEGLVASAVLESPELRSRYEERVAQLVTNVFRVEAITRRIDEVAKQVAETLMEIDPSAVESFRSGVKSLSKRFHQRAVNLRRQISPDSTTQLAGFETISLDDWHPRTHQGKAQLAEKQDAAGSPVLHIATTTGCNASWRTRVSLDRGKYRFSARLKTQGVVLDPADPQAGAGLRISGHRVGQKNAGDREWTPAVFDIEVRDDQSEIELVCELRAKRGVVWFELNSLRLSGR